MNVKSFHELVAGDWVQVMTSDARRVHCLITTDGHFAQSYCGNYFSLADCVGTDVGDRCQRCEKKLSKLAKAS